jgi:tRNA threonylcarbamoyladenosine biosynthesis protein TsaE
MPKKSWLTTLGQLKATAHEILNTLNGQRTVLFYGEMGAGKTTLIKSLCEHLGVTDTMGSPTFPIVNEYRTDRGAPVFHIDLYRLKSLQEAHDIGIEEYLYEAGAWCFVEWPQLIEGILPDACAILRIDTENENSRRIELSF